MKFSGQSLACNKQYTCLLSLGCFLSLVKTDINGTDWSEKQNPGNFISF